MGFPFFSFLIVRLVYLFCRSFSPHLGEMLETYNKIVYISLFVSSVIFSLSSSCFSTSRKFPVFLLQRLAVLFVGTLMTTAFVFARIVVTFARVVCALRQLFRPLTSTPLTAAFVLCKPLRCPLRTPSRSSLLGKSWRIFFTLSRAANLFFCNFLGSLPVLGV